MKIKKIIALSWGLVQDREYDMGDATILTGPTGAGKSTLIDALQTVMTAARQGAFSYNPGQDEISQNSRSGKSKRTLASYIVGAEDNLFARPEGAHGYVAVVFAPSTGETGESFTSVMACEATVENGPGGRRTAVQERLMFLVVNGEMSAEDFQNTSADGLISRVPVENCYLHLKKRYGADKVTNFGDNKGEFLRCQYGMFRGMKFVSLDEALHAAKAWSSSIAYRPIGSVDELIKHQVLEEQNLDSEVTKISEMMRTIAELRREAERLATVIAALQTLDGSGGDALKCFQEVLKLQALSAVKEVAGIEQAIAYATKTRDAAKATIAEFEAQDAACSTENESLLERKAELMAKRSGSTIAAEKDQLERDLRLQEGNVKQKIGNIHSVLEQLRALVACAEEGVTVSFANTSSDLQMARLELAAVLDDVKALRLDDLGRAVADMNRGNVTVEGLLALNSSLANLDDKAKQLKAVLSENEGCFAEVVEQASAELSSQLTRAQASLKEKKARADSLSTGGSNYPTSVLVAIRHLEENIPGIKVDVLCDLVKPKSAAWQNAIEGFMGNDRFALFVDAKHEKRATESLKSLRSRGGASVVQGSKAQRDAERMSLKSGSILEELEIDHDVAYSYMLAKYGSTMKVSDVEELRQVARGVTRDGYAASSYKMYVCAIDDAELLFGAEAKRNAAERLKRDVVSLEDNIVELTRTQEALKKLARTARSTTLEVTLPYAKDATASFSGVLSLKKRIDSLDLSEIAELEEEKNALEARLMELARESNKRNQDIGALRGKINTAEESIASRVKYLAPAQEKVAETRVELEKLCAMDAGVDFAALWETLGEEAQDASVPVANIQNRINQAGQKLVAAHSNFTSELTRYNEKVRPAEQISYVPAVGFRGTADTFAETYPLLMDSLSSVKLQLRQQQEVGIADSVERLKKAETEFNDVFTCQFCFKVKSKVDTGVSTLKALNRELQSTPFGTDRYRIDWDWVPEYKKFYDFFSAMNALGDTPSGDLFSGLQLAPEQEKVREELKSLLLDGNEEKAVKRLQEISDYRNYRVYDVWKESESGSKVRLSQWGTGSGGQLETPAYIIRAAILSHALKHFTAKGPHLRLMVNDESFAKMDETRARAVIRYLNVTLGFQIISAMPTRSATSLKDEFNREISFSRMEAMGMGEVNGVSQAQEKILKTDALRSLWEKQRETVREQAVIDFEAQEAQREAA